MVDPEGWTMRYRELFGDREFRALFVADAMSITGSYLARVAVAGLVFHRTGSATLTALAFALSYAPYLLSPWLSSLADLFPRRMLLILCDLARAVCIGLILVPGLALPFVMALLFLEATWRIPWGAARLALLTDILSPEAFPAGNALIASVRQALQVGGFAVGGVVVALIGVRPTLAFDAFTFLLSAAIVVVAVRRRAAPWRTRRVAVTSGAPSPARGGEQPARESDRATDVRPGTWVSTVEGVRSVVRNPKMVQLFALLGLGPAMAVITEGLAVPFAADLGGGLRLAGLIMAAPPLGTVIGLFALGRLPMDVQRRLIAPLSLGTGLAVVLAGLAVSLPAANLFVLTLLFVCGGCVAYISTIQSEISMMVESSMRGRVFGLANAVMQISQGLAIVLAGAVAGTGRLTFAIAIIAAALSALTVVALRFRPRRTAAWSPTAAA